MLWAVVLSPLLGALAWLVYWWFGLSPHDRTHPALLWPSSKATTCGAAGQVADKQQQPSVYVLGVSGPSRSGKTRLMYSLLGELEGFVRVGCAPVSQDETFRIEYWEEHRTLEWPDAADFDMLKRSLRDEIAATRKYADQHGADGPFLVLVEGFLLFWDDEVFDMLDGTIFIECDREVCRERRLATTASTEEYFDNQIWPGFLSYLDHLHASTPGEVGAVAARARARTCSANCEARRPRRRLNSKYDRIGLVLDGGRPADDNVALAKSYVLQRFPGLRERLHWRKRSRLLRVVQGLLGASANRSAQRAVYPSTYPKDWLNSMRADAAAKQVLRT